MTVFVYVILGYYQRFLLQLLHAWHADVCNSKDFDYKHYNGRERKVSDQHQISLLSRAITQKGLRVKQFNEKIEDSFIVFISIHVHIDRCKLELNGGGSKIKLGKKRIEIATIVTISLICIGFGNMLLIESGSRLTVGGTEVRESYAIKFGDVDSNGKVDMRDISLIARSFPDSECDPRYDVTGDGKLDFRDIAVTAQNFGKGVFCIDIPGDASGLYMMCEMARQFTASKLEWSTSMPSYPSGYVEFNLVAKTLGLEKLNDWSYHLGLRGLEEGSIISTGYVNYMLIVQAISGDLDFIFYDCDDNYPYYYHTADIVGTLKGSVYFHIDLPGLAEFHFEGRELAIQVRVG